MGVPPVQAIKLITIENSKATVRDLKSEVQKQYELNKIIKIQFIWKGKVLSDATQIAKLRLNN